MTKFAAYNVNLDMARIRYIFERHRVVRWQAISAGGTPKMLIEYEESGG